MTPRRIPNPNSNPNPSPQSNRRRSPRSMQHIFQCKHFPTSWEKKDLCKIWRVKFNKSKPYSQQFFLEMLYIYLPSFFVAAMCLVIPKICKFMQDFYSTAWTAHKLPTHVEHNSWNQGLGQKRNLMTSLEPEGECHRWPDICQKSGGWKRNFLSSFVKIALNSCLSKNGNSLVQCIKGMVNGPTKIWKSHCKKWINFFVIWLRFSPAIGLRFFLSIGLSGLNYLHDGILRSLRSYTWEMIYCSDPAADSTCF